ncbi:MULTISPECIES: diguanylate cyclase [unclassified Actinotalea]|uniref:sensor domain-containing diguanylate cyclase n=1 Tax=unclassified Actinotalea TaxID=2638618 RepID=UPI0015F54F52|nr:MULTISPECIES: diguanylate cyclase [unclassified Actinotalea]
MRRLRPDGPAARGAGPTGIVTELRRSHVALVAALAAMLAMALVTSGYLLVVSEPAVVRSTNLTREARLMQEGMLNQETGLRGWLATGDEVFLGPYEQGRADVDAAGARLLEYAADDPGLTALVVETMLARQAWQSWADDVVDGTTRISALTPAATTRLLLAGKDLFDVYRAADTVTIDTVVEQRNAALVAQRGALVAGMGGSVVTVTGAAALATRRRRRLTSAVIAPVDELLRTIDALREGDLSARVPVTGISELDTMGSALDRLASDLQAAGELGVAREERLALLAERLASVVRIAREVSGSTSVRYVAESVSDAAADLLGAPVTLWIRGDDGELHAVRCSDDPHGTVPSSDTPLPPAVVASAADARPVAEEQGSAHPLVLGGSVVGVLHLGGIGAQAGRAVDPDTLEVLTALLSTAAAALESARLHGSARDQAEHDALTRLPNRRRLEADLAVEWERAERYGRPLTFLMLDLDHFKRLNDQHGHLAGDAVLRAVAHAVRRELRSSDTAYRFGGEEIAVLLRETDAATAQAAAERLRAAVADVVVPDVPTYVTASVGVAYRTDDMLVASDLVGAADAALYTAKRSGRDRVALALV